MVIENVEKIRKAKGIQKKHIAEKLNLSPMGYSHISKKGCGLTAERLKIIAEVFKVEPGVFFDDELTNNVIKELNNVGAKSARFN